MKNLILCLSLLSIVPHLNAMQSNATEQQSKSFDPSNGLKLFTKTINWKYFENQPVNTTNIKINGKNIDLNQICSNQNMAAAVAVNLIDIFNSKEKGKRYLEDIGLKTTANTIWNLSDKDLSELQSGLKNLIVGAYTGQAEDKALLKLNEFSNTIAKDITNSRNEFAKNADEVKKLLDATDLLALKKEFYEKSAQLESDSKGKIAVDDAEIAKVQAELVKERANFQKLQNDYTTQIHKENPDGTRYGINKISATAQEISQKRNQSENKVMRLNLQLQKLIAAQMKNKSVERITEELDKLADRIEKCTFNYYKIWNISDNWIDFPEEKQRFIGKKSIVNPAFDIREKVINALTSDQ